MLSNEAICTLPLKATKKGDFASNFRMHRPRWKRKGTKNQMTNLKAFTPHHFKTMTLNKNMFKHPSPSRKVSFCFWSFAVSPLSLRRFFFLFFPAGAALGLQLLHGNSELCAQLFVRLKLLVELGIVVLASACVCVCSLERGSGVWRCEGDSASKLFACVFIDPTESGEPSLSREAVVRTRAWFWAALSCACRNTTNAQMPTSDIMLLIWISAYDWKGAIHCPFL